MSDVRIGDNESGISVRLRRSGEPHYRLRDGGIVFLCEIVA
jgi:hypothetical protein